MTTVQTDDGLKGQRPQRHLDGSRKSREEVKEMGDKLMQAILAKTMDLMKPQSDPGREEEQKAISRESEIWLEEKRV